MCVCYKLNGYATPPSNIHVSNPTPQCDGIRRWGLWRWWGREGGVLTSGISALSKETPENSLAPFCLMRSQREEGLLQTRNWTLTRYRMCWSLDLGLPSHQTEEQISSVYQPSSLWYCVLAARTQHPVNLRPDAPWCLNPHTSPVELIASPTSAPVSPPPGPFPSEQPQAQVPWTAPTTSLPKLHPSQSGGSYLLTNLSKS